MGIQLMPFELGVIRMNYPENYQPGKYSNV